MYKYKLNATKEQIRDFGFMKNEEFPFLNTTMPYITIETDYEKGEVIFHDQRSVHSLIAEMRAYGLIGEQIGGEN